MKFYVTNLPEDTSDTELADLFSSFGKVTTAASWGVVCREHAPDHVGLVSLTIEPKAANAAAALMSGMAFRDHVLSVEVV